MGEWREALGREVVRARQVVTKLLASRLTFTPESRDGRDGFRFMATGNVAKLIAGVVPGELSYLHTVASPQGTEYFYTLSGSAVRAAQGGRARLVVLGGVVRSSAVRRTNNRVHRVR